MIFGTKKYFEDYSSVGINTMQNLITLWPVINFTLQGQLYRLNCPYKCCLERWTVNRDGQELGDAVREDGGRGEGRAHVSAIEGRLPGRKFERTTQS